MAFKFFAFCAIVAVARAGVIAPAVHTYAAPAHYAAPAVHTYAAPAAVHSYAAPALAHYAAPAIAKTVVAAPVLHKTVVADDYDPNPQYSYSYDIHDSLTGDAKSQHETRNGDVVQGSYSLIDADGSRRTVDYTADPHHGFNAVVRKEPLVHKTVVAAAPVVAKYAAPLAYAAPVAKTLTYAQPAYAAPAVHAYHH